MTVNNCRLDLEDRGLLASLPQLPQEFRTFARPAFVDVDWHKSENQGPIGSCFPAGTKVTMADGTLRPIENVRFGDYVLTHSRSIQPVIDTMNREYSGDMVTVFAKGWGRLTMTADHVVRAVRNDEEVWLRADELRLTDEMIVSHGVRESSCDHVLMSDFLQLDKVRETAGVITSYGSLPVWNELELTENTCFVIGLYVAEGSTCFSETGTPCRAVWTMHEKETESAAKINAFAQSMGLTATVKTRRESKAVNIEIDSVIVADFMKNTCGRFCNHKKIPVFILRGSYAQKMAFLQGYYAGDGSKAKMASGIVAASGNRVRANQTHAATASTVLSQQVATLAVSIGMKPGRTVTKTRTHQRYDSHQVYLYSKDALALYDKPVADIGLRKLKESASGQRRKIREITVERVQYLSVFDFTVAQDHSFVADGLVVHNCQGNDLASCLERLQYVRTGSKESVVQLSRIFAYLATQKIDGLLGSDRGSTISGGVKLALRDGVPPETLTGYPRSYPARSERDRILSAANYAAGEPFKAHSSWQCPEDPEEAMNFIGGGGAISLGISWYSGIIPSDRVVKRFSPPGNSGGHAMFIGGYTAAGNIIGVNSHGDGPYQITPDAWRQMMRHRWTAAIGLVGTEEPAPKELDWSMF